jgi:hypothetical protein
MAGFQQAFHLQEGRRINESSFEFIDQLITRSRMGRQTVKESPYFTDITKISLP